MNKILTETPTEKEVSSDFGAGGFFMLYKNEGEEGVRQFAVDFTALNEQAKKENFTKDTYTGVLYGFESAIRIVLGNYNLSPRNQPVDSLQESERFVALMQEALDKEQAKQEKEMLEDVK